MKSASMAPGLKSPMVTSSMGLRSAPEAPRRRFRPRTLLARRPLRRGEGLRSARTAFASCPPPTTALSRCGTRALAASSSRSGTGSTARLPPSTLSAGASAGPAPVHGATSAGTAGTPSASTGVSGLPKPEARSRDLAMFDEWTARAQGVDAVCATSVSASMRSGCRTRRSCSSHRPRRASSCTSGGASLRSCSSGQG